MKKFKEIVTRTCNIGSYIVFFGVLNIFLWATLYLESLDEAHLVKIKYTFTGSVIITAIMLIAIGITKITEALTKEEEPSE